MVKIIFIHFFCLILFAAVSTAQTELPSTSQTNEIEKKQNELNLLRSEIEEIQKDIELKTGKEKESYDVIEKFNRQNYLLNKLISSIKKEIIKKNSSIDISEKKIKKLKKEVEDLKENYAKYIRAIYKRGRLSELEYLFDSQSIQQAFVRYKYLREFSEKREKDLMLLQKKKNELSKSKKELINELKEKELLTKQKEEEQQRLIIKISERKRIVEAIKKDKDELKKELALKRKSAEAIQKLIADLIEEERRRKEELERRNKTDVENGPIPLFDTGNLASFSDLKGRMNWPIQNADVIRKFGQNRNTQLNTVTLNYGVDLKAYKDTEVKSVAEGVVSIISWVPGYGTVIILSHKDNYKTVYGHIGEVFVIEGEKVSRGSAIGKLSESLEGYILHFEIWNERDNQNPELWLVKR